MLYAVHPIHSESVAAISIIGDPIVTFFMLLSLTLYVKHLDSPGKWLYLFLYPAYLLALFTKESGIMFLAIVLLYHYAFGRKIKLAPFIALGGITVFYLLVRIFFFKGATGGPAPDMSLSGMMSRVPGIFVSITGYIRMLIAPFSLHMGHEHRLFKAFEPAAIAGAVMTVAAAVYAFKARRSSALIFFAIGWFFITLAPVSNIYPISFYMSDHYMYLPSIGFFLIVAAALRWAYDKKAFKAYALAALILLTSFYSCRTIQQNNYWKDAVTFYERTLKYAPTSTRLLNNLAGKYLLQGDLAKAAELYKKALETDPNFMLAYYNLGIINFKQKNMQGAVKYCEAALQLDPNYAPAYNQLGLIYWAMERRDDAIAAYNKAIAVSPDNPMALHNLALAYNALNMKEKSVELLKRAISIRPDYVEAYSDLATVYAESGKTEEAVAAIKKALEIYPNAADLYNRMGFLYFMMGRPDEAVSAYNKAIALRPDNVAAMNDLAVLYYKSGRPEQAFELLERAIAIRPDYAGAYANLGRMYLESGKKEEAAAWFKKALEIDPSNKQAKDGLSLTISK
jgi:tetratricopeptide (TPR) repeat protein